MSTEPRLALVTGASAGIGREITLSLARQGMRVVACARGKRALAALAREAQEESLRVVVFSCDVTREAEVRKLAVFVRRECGGVLDVLVNNAGGHRAFGEFEDLTVADWEQAYALNVLSVVRMTRALLPLLRRSKRAPGIVNLASAVALSPGAFHPHYSAAKAALLNLSVYLAKRYGPEGIRVNAVAPGTITGPAWDRNVAACARDRRMTHAAAERFSRERQLAKIPLRRLGEAADVAAAVAFLASASAAWISGVCIPVDGGATR